MKRQTYKAHAQRAYAPLALLVAGMWLCLAVTAYVGIAQPLLAQPPTEAPPTLRPTRAPRPTSTVTPMPPPNTPPAPTPLTCTDTPAVDAFVTVTLAPSATPTIRPTRRPTATPKPSATHFLMIQPQAGGGDHPTLADFWDGRAQFVVDVVDTVLPMGESDTLVMSNGELWSYLHASERSAGTLDRCGNPVEFPGCTVIYRSADGGYTFQHDFPPICQFECKSCPCDSERDHVDQQQYPRVAFNGRTLVMVYEYRGRIALRRSSDGLAWSAPEDVPASGVWERCPRNSRPEERIGQHPYVPYKYECLVGGPPGVYVEGNRLYVFAGLGQNPGSMGCYYGAVDAPARSLRKCTHNPLFTGAAEYGPLEEKGPQTNPYFDFRMISSADVHKIGDRYYMLYEGVRGPGPGDPGDTQFGLGLARSLTSQIDGAWEKFPGNPILVDQPGNIGLGHADLVILNGQTVLYTSLNGVMRSRLILIWK